MTTLVFGSTGQLAIELQRQLPDATFLGREHVDLTNPHTCADAIRRHEPDVVINAAAYTAVDSAEDDEATAALVNGAAPAEMASASAELDIPLVHVSTDYVFDGAGNTPFHPDHPTAPLCAYGRTKLAGEDGIRAAGSRHAILRTSWMFSAHGKNFVKTILRLTQTSNALNVVADQIGGPTSACSVAKACIEIAEQLKTRADVPQFGTYHFSGREDVSWADFARAVFDHSGRKVTVTDIPASAYPTPATRPHNSRLDCTTLHTNFGIARPDWAVDLADVLKELEITQ
ncbi:dTDP-4-dehydrorhamnose reductase [Pacificibacter maritimus]|uniref:dTDP-4-dehydrorhamnose reductase n=1 Tax=Pacificibacter maritimus TaxID=762213 RepID=A0A3N4ULU9_9RHOB|nr:dTDP-4-dehydrorhamnose reductase [Pacificibacter maritimus]RPE62960.1 dTDP-4-dehydrorhamnose reductase [Pacificibacter maritimus]